MKKTGKIIVSLLASLTLICSSAISASATETIPGARWCHMSYNTSYNPKCDLSVSTSYLSGRWSTYYPNAFYNWNNYSFNRVYVSNASFSNSNVDLFSYGGAWPWDENIAAFTSLVDKSGHVFSGGMRADDSPISSFGDRINYAGVTFNPITDINYIDNTNIMIEKFMTHELGHCINLGHETGESVMKQGWLLNETNYYTPQVKDRLNIAQMYNAIYS